jgi:hypothetical protein
MDFVNVDHRKKEGLPAMTTTETSKIEIPEGIERQICERLIDDALAASYTISVFEGEDRALEYSTDRAAILAAMASTSDDALTFGDIEGAKIGVVLLVYGNGADVIADCSDCPAIDALLLGAEALAEG